MESDSQPCSSQRASVIPTILCGGAGSRLWPMSRSDLPKPFIKLDDGQSLLQKEFPWGTLITLEKESDHTIQKLIINRNEEVLIPREHIDTLNCLILLGEVTISTDESIQSIKRTEHISISGKSEITIHNSSEESAIVIVLKST